MDFQIRDPQKLGIWSVFYISSVAWQKFYIFKSKLPTIVPFARSRGWPSKTSSFIELKTFEHFLLPGTLIVVDGRTANARFLKANLQRNWDYHHSEEYDQHFFELKEKPLGVYNQRQIDFCLGPGWN